MIVITSDCCMIFFFFAVITSQTFTQSNMSGITALVMTRPSRITINRLPNSRPKLNKNNSNSRMETTITTSSNRTSKQTLITPRLVAPLLPNLAIRQTPVLLALRKPAQKILLIRGSSRIAAWGPTWNCRNLDWCEVARRPLSPTRKPATQRADTHVRGVTKRTTIREI